MMEINGMKGNPKDSMKSTWRELDRSQWNLGHWFFERLNIQPTDLSIKVPVHRKDEKVPHMPTRYMHRWLLIQCTIPILLHHLYVVYTGRNLGLVAANAYYILAYQAIAVRELQILRNTGHEVGFLDGDVHPRDGVPDVGVTKTALSLVYTSLFRTACVGILSYRATIAPADASWGWLFVEVCLYPLILDFWFYVYHRLMHEIGSLWKFHRTHHLTKHPNSLLVLYADTEQEIFDIAVIPILAYMTMKYMGFPMTFYEWFVCNKYVTFAELAGHSGLRLHASTPNPINCVLRLFDAELIIEDHDLHHRKGYKTSGNYGKQSRLWDRIFGTVRERVECTRDNIDYDNVKTMPIY